MKEKDLLNRISINPKIMVGKPVIQGTRLSVEYILNLLAHGANVAEILELDFGQIRFTHSVTSSE
jgi:uncharacterized protein (DUF433 family)